MNTFYSAMSKTLVVLFVVVSFPALGFSGAQFTSVTTSVFGILQQSTTSWGNPIWGDIDNDGDLDLIIPTNNSDPFVYKNNGNDNFTRIQNGLSPGMSGIILPTGYGIDWRGFAFGDYDGDGKLDLFVAINSDPDGAFNSNLLFKGNGSPGPGQTYFSQVSLDNEKHRGQAGFWVDSDNDGRLELFVKNYFADGNPASNLLYGTRFGVFSNIIDLELGRAVYQSFNTQHPYGHGTICSFTDYDNDNQIDVAFSGLRKALYHKAGTGYVESSAIPSVPGESCRGIAWGDYDNDGYPDLYVTTGSFDTNVALGTYLFHNNQNGTFTEVASTSGVYTNYNTWAAVWGDYDNDGYLDLFVTCSGNKSGRDPTENANFLYRNNGPNAQHVYTFTAQNEAAVQMYDHVSFHKTAAWADYNNDGFLDLVVKDGIQDTMGTTHLVKNNGNSNHFIEVYLTGLGPGLGSNVRGIGARVQVTYSPALAVMRSAYRVNNGGGGGEYRFARQRTAPFRN